VSEGAALAVASGGDVERCQSRKSFGPVTGDRGFETGSLQRRVYCELDFRAHVTGAAGFEQGGCHVLVAGRIAAKLDQGSPPQRAPRERRGLAATEYKKLSGRDLMADLTSTYSSVDGSPGRRSRMAFMLVAGISSRR